MNGTKTMAFQPRKKRQPGKYEKDCEEYGWIMTEFVPLSLLVLCKNPANIFCMIEYSVVQLQPPSQSLHDALLHFLFLFLVILVCFVTHLENIHHNVVLKSHIYNFNYITSKK